MNDSGQKYLRKVARDENGMSDIYAVTDAWKVTSAVGQAVKKLLMAGKRGHKDYWTDLQQARDAIDREFLFRPVEAPAPLNVPPLCSVCHTLHYVSQTCPTEMRVEKPRTPVLPSIACPGCLQDSKPHPRTSECAVM